MKCDMALKCSQFRVIKNGLGEYWIQKKRWLFWSDLVECYPCYHGSVSIFLYFDSYEEACTKIATIVKESKDREEYERKRKEQEVLPPCPYDQARQPCSK